MKNFFKILGNNALALIIGLLIALIQLIPEPALSKSQKFWLAFVLLLTIIAYSSIKSIYNKLNIIRQFNSQIKPYINVIPQTIKFINSTRIYKFKNNCEVDIYYEHNVKNDSNSEINQISIPFYCDCNNPNDPSNRLEIKKILIDTIEVPNPQEYYKKISINKFSNNKTENGQIIIDLNYIGGLLSKKSIIIKIEAIAKDGWYDVFDESWISVDADFVTEKALLRIHPPEEKSIILISKNDFPKCFRVFHKESGFVDHKEISEKNAPKCELDGSINWELTNIKLGYSYTIYFKVV